MLLVTEITLVVGFMVVKIKSLPLHTSAIAFRADFLNLQLWQQTNVQLVCRVVWSSAALGSIITESSSVAL